MPSLRSLCQRVLPVSPEALAAEVRGLFEDDPDLRLLPVADDGGILGVVDRRTALDPEAMPAQSVLKLMSAPSAVYDADEDATTVSRALVDSGDAAALQGFLVLEGDAYLGVGDGTMLLNALTRQADDVGRLLDAVRREAGAPLTELLAVAKLLQRQPLSLDGASHLRAIVAAAQTTLGVLASLEPGMAAPDSETATDTLLADLMDEIDALWQVQAGLRDLRLITSRRAPPGLRVKVDAARFRRVVDSLIEDALESAQGAVVEVRLGAEREGSAARIEVHVRDARHVGSTSGPAPVLHESPEGANFVQSRRAHAIEAMGGQLRYRHNDGTGLTAMFELWLPLADGERAADWTPEDSTEGALGHILIVDDNATNRLVAESLCQGFGFTCETAQDGPEAIEAVRLRAFDLVLMDIKMPGMDGMEATRAIRALGVPGEGLPVVALTANADPAAVRGYLAAGMCGLVEKPIKPEALFKAIAEGLNVAAARVRTAAAA